MLTSVEFHVKLRFDTQEVEDVWAKWSLPSEFHSELITSQQWSELPFGVCHLAPESSGHRDRRMRIFEKVLAH